MAWIESSAVEWAQVGTAAFAAVAAGASWASVAQTRRERRERDTPRLHLEVAETVPGGHVVLSLDNIGGPAKLVTIAAVQGDRACVTHAPPSAFMRPGESRTFGTDLPPAPDKNAVAVVTCFDSRGRRLYAWSANNQDRVWKVRGFRSVGQRSLDDVFEVFYPGVRPMSHELVPLKLGERLL